MLPPEAAIAIGSKKQLPNIVSSLELTNACNIESIISADVCIDLARYKYGFLDFIMSFILIASIFAIREP